MQEVSQKWDRIYSKSDRAIRPEPCATLSQYAYLLPSTGTALDVACGLGGNALFLAQRGLAVTAVDISAVAIEQIESHQHPLISARCEAIEAGVLEDASYNVIVVSNFLDRSMCKAIMKAVAPDGLLFYQTFIADKVNLDSGPSNPDYLLDCNELLSLFHGMDVLVFNDMATVGDASYGLRNQSLLIAKQRS